MAETDEPTGMYDVLAALEDVIMAADPAKREQLAKTLDAYHEDFPEDVHWAVGRSHRRFCFISSCRSTVHVGLRHNRSRAACSGLLTASPRERFSEYSIQN
jgi:hypothetical protein